MRRQRQQMGLYRNPGFWRFLGLALSLLVVVTVMLLLLPPLDFGLGIVAVMALLTALTLRSLTLALMGVRRTAIIAWIGMTLSLCVMIPLLVLSIRTYLENGGEVLVPLAAVVLILSNVIVLPILGGPTRKGREVLDQIEGLQHYIEVAEEDRLAQAPAMSVAQFERILPYAMALGLEKHWVARFRGWLEAAMPDSAPAERTRLRAAADRSGLSRHYGTGAVSGSAAPSLERQLAGSLTAALPVASSSGSGSSGSSGGGSSSGSSGGGSSGGGGGGGGGGGW